MRLFTALWPTPEVVAALAAQVRAPALEAAGWRANPSARWHVTLAYYGEDDPGRRARELERRVAGAPAPRLRIAGTGRFPGVLWAGVQPAGPADAGALAALAERAGADPHRFVAHLTLGRSGPSGPDRAGAEPGPDPDVVPEVRAGPWWTPAEALLVASVRSRTGLVYEPLHRVGLDAS